MIRDQSLKQCLNDLRVKSAAMASIHFFFLNELVIKRGIGQLKYMPNNGGYLLALDLFNFVHG